MTEQRKAMMAARDIIDPMALVPPQTRGALVPTNMGEALEFAKEMSRAQFSLPSYLKDNPGDCLRIVMIAGRTALDPFMLAGQTYKTKNKSGEERLEFQAQAIHAIVLASGVLDGDLRTEIQGESLAKMTCTVTGKRRGGNVHVETYHYAPIQPKNSPLWTTQPRQQMIYYSERAWCRAHAPDALMGLIAREDPPIDRGEIEIVEDKRPTSVEAVTAHLTPEAEPVDAEYSEPETPVSEAPKPPEPPSPAEQKAIEIMDNLRRHAQPQKLSQYWISCEKHLAAMPPELAESVAAAYDKRMAEMMPKTEKQDTLV